MKRQCVCAVPLMFGNCDNCPNNQLLSAWAWPVAPIDIDALAIKVAEKVIAILQEKRLSKEGNAREPKI